MFTSIKIEEYMEPELSGIFWVKTVAKYKLFESTEQSYLKTGKNLQFTLRDGYFLLW